jgi:DNA invertase Pin-like site-specific DNA recombinase
MLVGYMRVSTDTEKQSTDLQYDALVSAGIDERHLFEDRGSGSKTDRPGLRDCLDYLKPGDTLVVWKLDRLGRSLPHLLNVVGGLREKQVGFHSLTESIDTTTIQGDLLFNIFGALAQFERALIVERVNAGLAAAARRGKHGGRPRAVEGEKLEQVVTALKSGASKASICRTFNLKRSTLIDTLRRVGWAGQNESASLPTRRMA